MNFVSKFAETLADVPNPVCVFIIILIFILICLVIFCIVCFLEFLKGSFERYIEKLVCERENKEFAYFRKYDVPKIVSDELKKQAFNGSTEHYSPKLRERIEGKAVK